MGNILHHFRQQYNSAFTLVEILVVVIIVAILAGVTITSYGLWRQDTAVTQVKSDLTQAAAAMENVRNFSDAGYPTTLPTTFTPSQDVTITYGNGTGNWFCLNGVSDMYPTEQYRYKSDDNPSITKASC